jgi:hypothetical protein
MVFVHRLDAGAEDQFSGGENILALAVDVACVACLVELAISHIAEVA